MIPLLEGKRLERLRGKLQSRLRAYPDEELRAGLANHYRGRRDMAGRWGTAISGLASLDEQQAFAGVVRAHGGTRVVEIRGIPGLAKTEYER
ncbi:hypothetical protein [Microbacterium sp. NPDC056569]|uniref:hypothetical protein n=1 Tax=Microbacterium sp. NPDC056569 TaxID=3345867 RepID=UPI003671F625